MDRQLFEQMYQGQAPWDTGGPQPAILCFSDEEPGSEGPRRITRQEIRAAFQDGWKVRQIEPTRFESLEVPGGMAVSPGGPKAWLATIERT
jgi:hypothetical protein